MFGPTISVTRKQQGLPPDTSDRAMLALRSVEVLVGIPEATATRRGEQINNAEIMYIQTHGSPIRNIPPRPVIEPAIANDRKIIGRELQEAAAAWMARDAQSAMMYLNRAGTAGRDAAKAWFTNPLNGWPPNAPATIARKGSDRPLIHTGELRRSIVYVIRNAPAATSVQALEEANAKRP
jgi:hypothetical protein